MSRPANTRPPGAVDDTAGRDAETHVDEADRGLGYDLQTLIRRRHLLGLFGGATAATLLAACGAGGTSPGASSSTSSSTSSTGSGVADPSRLTEVPDETSGPYPGDGSNGPDVLDDSGIVRSDIRSSFGSTTTAGGVPLAVRLTVRDTFSGDPLARAAVYLWHCDRDGNYSLYSNGVTGENYLRGVQPVDATGTATFTSIFPGCYAGRWPHIHFEVYASASDATSSGPIVKTSQIALPRQACTAAYATTGYQTSAANLDRVSLSADMVFGDDGGIHQVATMSGDTATGYTAALTIGV